MIHMKARKQKRIAALSGTLAVLASVGLWLAPGASADSDSRLGGCGFLGRKICGHGGVNGNNQRVYACDTYENGEGFLTRYWTIDGRSGYVGDSNGAIDPCGEVWPGGYISKYQVCRNTKPWICRPEVDL
ncbi:hypothetical protein WEB32_00505 [Streptomyces netropsis]